MPSLSSLVESLLDEKRRDALLDFPKGFKEWYKSRGITMNEWSNLDRAVLSGFHSPNVAFAFASGYQSAIHHLVPGLPRDKIVSFCVSEEGGAHPGSIRASIQPDDETRSHQQHVVNGKKRWISLACEADLFLVAASAGQTSDGLNDIKMVKVPRRDGITTKKMEGVPFMPEISHGEVLMQDVRVEENLLLPGDGYVDYIRPFRTVEDVHVLAAILGHVQGIAIQFKWPNAIQEIGLAMISSLRSLAMADLRLSSSHVVLGGIFKLVEGYLEDLAPFWSNTSDSTRKAWKRDSVIIQVASNARKARLERAWDKMKGQGL
ncbi:MAG: acyl-CoA dehydrogenase family protein [Candidatus Hodarchaeota archaeon]